MVYFNATLNYLIGLFLGLILEFAYRSLDSKKIVRPLLINAQIYGLTALGLYLIYLVNPSLPIIILLTFLLTTGLEFILGYSYLKFKKVRLWDYSQETANFKGIICLKFSAYWLVLGLLYFFLIIPYLEKLL